MFVFVAAIAMFCAFVLPHFLPTRKYALTDATGGMAGWQYGTVLSCKVFRGDGIPTILLGNAHSDYVEAIGNGNLPFALVLENEDGLQSEIGTDTYFEGDDGPTSKTIIRNQNAKIVVRYKLRAGAARDPVVVLECFSINGISYDLKQGRLFRITARSLVVQVELESISRTIIPRYSEGDAKVFALFLDWWRTVKRQYSIDAS